MRQSSQLRFFFGIFLLLPAAPLNAELFQWTDSRGAIHFTDNFYSVPESLRGSPNLITRNDWKESVAFQEPIAEPKVSEGISPPGPEPTQSTPPVVIHYNPQPLTIVVVHSIMRRPKEKRCFLPEGCAPAFRPDFNDRRYVHPSAFDPGGSRQFIHPGSFRSPRRSKN